MMGILRLMMLIGAAGFAFHHWQDGRDTGIAAQTSSSPNGFVAATMPSGAPPGAVVILAPVDCPSDAAQRADALADALTRQGIRTVRSASYRADVESPTDAQRAAVDRAVAVLNGEIPAVFVNGMAKANPTADEVVRELERTR